MLMMKMKMMSEMNGCLGTSCILFTAFYSLDWPFLLFFPVNVFPFDSLCTIELFFYINGLGSDMFNAVHATKTFIDIHFCGFWFAF